MSVSRLIDKLLLKGASFAAWAMPGATTEFMISKPEEVRFIGDESDLESLAGFVFAPFQSHSNCPAVLLQGTHLKTIAEIENFQPATAHAMASRQNGRHRPFVITHSQYLTDVNETIEALKNTSFSKVVLSRIAESEKTTKATGELFLHLQANNPKAFVYVVNIPKVGIWLGATPEILLQSNSCTCKTMSLAGTQPKQYDADYRWRTKEIEEQAFVSRYILEAFHDLAIHPYTTIGPTTLESGGIAHLQTTFQFNAELLKGKLSAFVKRLHPTPAVCGLPKKEALAFIAGIEKHKRRYYTGYLGTWQMNGATNLFVNLRCMELVNDSYLIYVGGGITSRSDAAEEWEETEKKAQVLRSAL